MLTKLNLNRITGSSVMAILLNGWISPFGGASAVEGLLSTGPTPSSSLCENTIFFKLKYLADPVEARGCFTNTSVTD